MQKFPCLAVNVQAPFSVLPCKQRMHKVRSLGASRSCSKILKKCLVMVEIGRNVRPLHTCLFPPQHLKFVRKSSSVIKAMEALHPPDHKIFAPQSVLLRSFARVIVLRTAHAADASTSLSGH